MITLDNSQKVLVNAMAANDFFTKRLLPFDKVFLQRCSQICDFGAQVELDEVERVRMKLIRDKYVDYLNEKGMLSRNEGLAPEACLMVE